MPKKKEVITNEVQNWYGHIPDSLKTQYHNPNYNNHLINLPFRLLIVGNSGSGKTTLVLELLHRMDDTFGNIIICTKNADEPLYKFLRTKIKAEQLQVYEGIDNIPDLDSFDPELQHLIVFDDLVLEKDQTTIEQYFIRSRKIAKGVSCIYLTQSYFKTPKTIRLNSNYIILKKLSSTRDLNMIMNDFSLGIEKEVLIKMYKFCTEEKSNFLFIDIDAPLENRFRKNFLDIIKFN
jgi:ABC-type dipeptide/oligopeptide/nickel transport system ATPase component